MFSIYIYDIFYIAALGLRGKSHPRGWPEWAYKIGPPTHPHPVHIDCISATAAQTFPKF